MKPQTMAQALVNSNDFNELWAEVESVERLEDGSDLYTYPDGSQLKVSESSTKVV